MALALLTSEVKQEYGSAAELSLTAEAERGVGDALIAELWAESTTITPTTPSGWTALTSIGATSYKVWWFARIADGTSADNFKTTWTGSVGRLGGTRRVTGGPQAVVNWVQGTAAKGSSKEAKPGVATSASASNLAIDFWQTFSAPTIESTEAGWTASSGLIPTLSKMLTGIESSGTPVVKYTASQGWISWMLLIPPKEEEATSTPHNLTLLGVGS